MGGRSEERVRWPDSVTDRIRGAEPTRMSDEGLKEAAAAAIDAGDAGMVCNRAPTRAEIADHDAASAVHLAVRMLNTVALTAAKRGLRIELVQHETDPSPFQNDPQPFALITSVVTRPRPLG